MLSRPHLFASTEVTAAIHELFSNEALLKGMQAQLPEEIYQLILSHKDKIKSIDEFQKIMINPLVNYIEKKSTDSLTLSGVEHLDREKRYLFLSNHRDIVLDSAFINNSLFNLGFTTAQIAIGDNLMVHRLSELIFKLNKSFVVKRSGSATELYHYAVALSEYIHSTITSRQDSVWIAQREGRAKDGNDFTQVGLLKMLSLANKGDLMAYLKELNIVPVSISYEFNPCDHLLAQEYLFRLQNPEYKKSFQADLSHILLGLWGKKGGVHIHFGKPLQEELEVLEAAQNGKKQLSLLCNMVDNSIQANYRLRPINQVALSLLGANKAIVVPSSAEAKLELKQYFDDKRLCLKGDENGAGFEYLLKMYANPAINYMNVVGG